jgi:hypothetical protein
MWCTQSVCSAFFFDGNIDGDRCFKEKLEHCNRNLNGNTGWLSICKIYSREKYVHVTKWHVQERE